MSELNNATTFIGLLDHCSRIEVPQIQRDYAQGRETEAEVRLGFLNALHAALEPAGAYRASPMNLDFIYGSMEGDAEGDYFLPLDGQQRLTTLLLMHWYLAWQDGQLPDFQERLWDGRHSRFSYKVRPSSAEFFDELVKFAPADSPNSVSSVRKLLEDQPWFFLNWRLDPTIQSALTMLDDIHKRFGSSVGLYARLLDERQPAITFQLLQLKKFGLSDDLYIKMNARGKPLTLFETFKARFEEDLKALFPIEQRQIDGKSWYMRDFFALRMDTQWTDFFWSYRSTANKVFDSEVMNLFWTLAQLSLDPESKSFTADTVKLQNKQATVSYSALHDGGWLTRDFANHLISLLEAWSASGEGKLTRQLSSKYFDEEVLFRKAIKSPGGLDYAELLQFTAFVLYLTRWQTAVKADELQEWMRVVSNLAANTSYDHVEVFQRCMAGLRKLLPESRRILSHLAEMDPVPLGFSPQQVQEEVLKAKLMLAHTGWRDRIEKAELHGYFQGQIEFLLDFAGLREEATDGPVAAWSALAHAEKQCAVDNYLAKAEITFNEGGLVDPIDAPVSSYLWQRALLAVGDYLLPLNSNLSFGTNLAAEGDSWKRYLRGGKGDALGRRAYLKLLWDRLDVAAPVRPQLQQIIDTTAGLEPWRSVFVRYPQLLDYCERRKIRKTYAGQIYLLKSLQMNGAHAELFSYALYQDLKVASECEKLMPLKLEGYRAVSESSSEPQVLLSFDVARSRVNFAIESSDSQFRIGVKRDALVDVLQLESALINDFAFQESGDELVLLHARDSILDVLHELARALSDLPEMAS